MKYLLILVFVALLTFKASAQTSIGITKQGLKELEGYIQIISDSANLAFKPSKAINYKGEFASYVGRVSKVTMIRPGYALLTSADDKTHLKVFIFTKTSSAKAMRYKGRLVSAEGKLEVYNGSPTFRHYGTSKGSVYPLRLANPGCNCLKGEPSPARRIDTTKS